MLRTNQRTTIMTIIEQFLNARKFGVPILGIETPDQATTIQSVVSAVNGKGKTEPMITWDIVRGAQPANEAGKQELQRVAPDDNARMELMNPVGFLLRALELKERSIVFMQNAHRFYDDAPVMQAIWNVRDQFKASKRTLVLLGDTLKLPRELERDVIVFDEPLPSDSELSAIVKAVHEYAALKPPVGEQMQHLVKAARGLASFPAEQAVALSLTKEGADVKRLWELKRKMIEQTPGLTVYRGSETFDDIGGIDRLKDFGRRLFAGPEAPSVIVHIDEGEKMFAGAQSDSSGTTQDQFTVMLSEMEDHESKGIVVVGHPGTCKSMFAKALGNTFATPTLRFDAGAMKDRWVGSSEQRIRAVMKIIYAVAGRNAYWIMTCNDMGKLPPAFHRRFTDGIYFTDLPDDKEKPLIWNVNLKRFNLTGQLPNDDNWTGADIRNVCSMAYRLNIPLIEAATYTTPVAKSDPQSIERLRKLADGAWQSASYAGTYDRSAQTSGALAMKAERKVSL
jgi:SpoVK/Ycf46/Vps4 family AAA+-type ATPase